MLALFRAQETNVSPLGLIFQNSVSVSPTPLSLAFLPFLRVQMIPGSGGLLWPLLGFEVDFVLN